MPEHKVEKRVQIIRLTHTIPKEMLANDPKNDAYF